LREGVSICWELLTSCGGADDTVCIIGVDLTHKKNLLECDSSTLTDSIKRLKRRRSISDLDSRAIDDLNHLVLILTSALTPVGYSNPLAMLTPVTMRDRLLI